MNPKVGCVGGLPRPRRATTTSARVLLVARFPVCTIGLFFISKFIFLEIYCIIYAVYKSLKENWSESSAQKLIVLCIFSES